MTFLNPLVLLGLAAAAIPILVHLFNFRRPERVDFSTLRFVREVEATSMRRVRIRQWLLLALRTLAIVFLVLAFARPTLSGAGGGFEDGGARALALVLDNSRSMTLRDAQGSLLDQAKAAGAAAVEATGPGDERVVLPVAPPPEYRPVPFTTPGPALDIVAGLGPLAGAEPLTAAVARASAVLEGTVLPRREIVVVSDLQAATFTDSASAALPPGTSLTLVPLGARSQANTAVTDVRVVSRIIEPGRPVEVEATVVRYGGRAGTVGATLALDGQRVAETAVDLVPGEPQTVSFTITPPARGWLGGEVRIEEDAAAWDDARSFTLRVPPPPRVLVVRGDGQRADLVTLALGVAAERGGVVLNEISEGALAGADLDRYDAVVLVGPSGLGGAADRLAAFVAGGGGVLAFPGAEGEALNPLLQAVGGGRITGAVGETGGESIGSTSSADLDHPLFAGVFDQSSPTLERPDIRRAVRYVPGGGDETTLIGLQAGPPLLQEIRRGEGSVLLFGVAPDPAWSDLPQRGLFVPLLYRAAAYLAAGSTVADDGELSVREGGTVRVEGVEPGEPLRLVGPDDVALAPAQRTVPGAVLLDVDDAVARAGLYRVMQGERVLRTVAVNEDPRESDPAALDPDEAARQLEAVTGRPVRVLDAGAALAGDGEPAGLPLWTVFLGLALACLVAETLVTTRWRAEPAVVGV
jgi:hypothetical protein